MMVKLRGKKISVTSLNKLHSRLREKEEENMGIVFGKISVETPTYQSLGRVDGVEIRKYGEQFAATVCAKDFPDAPDKDSFSSAGFRVLANYIGVFSQAQNESAETHAAESIAMTAPVVMASQDSLPGQQLHSAGPLVACMNEDKDWTMSFLLPSKFIKEGKLPPKPLDSRVKIFRIKERTVAVKTYSGSTSLLHAEDVSQKVEQLIKSQMTTREPVYDKDGNLCWEFMGYNPPFTLSCFRTNEVAVLLREAQGTETTRERQQQEELVYV